MDKCPHNEVAFNETCTWCETCGMTLHLIKRVCWWCGQDDGASHALGCPARGACACGTPLAAGTHTVTACEVE